MLGAVCVCVCEVCNKNKNKIILMHFCTHMYLDMHILPKLNFSLKEVAEISGCLLLLFSLKVFRYYHDRLEDKT